MKIQRRIAALVLALALALGCGATAAAVDASPSPPPAAAAGLPVATGTKTEKNAKATIDYSNSSDGYVMVQYTAATTQKLKVQVSKSTTYTYNLPAKTWITFPFSEGDGTYKVTIFENTGGTKYAVVLSASINVKLTDEFAPFLRSNQYVDYASATNSVAQAAELVEGLKKTLGKDPDTQQIVGAVYDFVVDKLTYDGDKAADVVAGKLAGYLPVLDSVLEAKKGICFDYAALMTGMLRSQGVPCKLVTGYVPIKGGQSTFHAWISVWTETGWVSSIYFDGAAWHRMDPTFASSSGGSQSIMSYIGDGSNYTEKYLY